MQLIRRDFLKAASVMLGAAIAFVRNPLRRDKPARETRIYYVRRFDIAAILGVTQTLNAATFLVAGIHRPARTVLLTSWQLRKCRIRDDFELSLTFEYRPGGFDCIAGGDAFPVYKTADVPAMLKKLNETEIV